MGLLGGVRHVPDVSCGLWKPKVACLLTSCFFGGMFAARLEARLYQAWSHQLVSPAGKGRVILRRRCACGLNSNRLLLRAAGAAVCCCRTALWHGCQGLVSMNSGHPCSSLGYRDGFAGSLQFVMIQAAGWCSWSRLAKLGRSHRM